MDDPGELARPQGIDNVMSLAWCPGGAELAFASTHEMWCSLNTSDIFAISADGSGYRRVTQAPACPALGDFPRGIVRIPVSNPFASQYEASIYFQGAPAAQEISLAPNGSGVITFDDVADLGDGVMQRAILINPAIGGQDRAFGEDTAVDVQAGGTVEGRMLSLDHPNLSQRLMQSPSWRHDVAMLGYLFFHNSMYGIDSQPPPLQQGGLLVTAGSVPGVLGFADHLAYGPAAVRGDQILYAGEESLTGGIHLVTEGSDTTGELLVARDLIHEHVLGLAWLPDGSGFVYSLLERTPESEFTTRANIYQYSFDTQSVTRLTDFDALEYAGRLSVSPDGEWLVFEHATSWSFLTGELEDPELWVMDRAGGAMRSLVKNGWAPAWSN